MIPRDLEERNYNRLLALSDDVMEDQEREEPEGEEDD